MNSRSFVKGLDHAIRETSRLSGRPTSDLRPFICDGSPLACTVFIVGINPASNVTWDAFWNRKTGAFDKDGWLSTYEKERVERKKQQGKQRIYRWSPTRRRIELLLKEIRPHSCLETNIYSRATSGADVLTSRDEHTVIFEYLLRTIQPSVVYLHGEEPLAHFQARAPLLEQCRVTAVQLDYGTAVIYATPHLASRKRGLTDEVVRGWGRILKQAADKAMSTARA